MATTVEQIYDAEHHNAPYYQSLLAWLGTQKFKKSVEVGFAWSMSAQAYLETQESQLISIDVNDAMQKAWKIEEQYPGRWRLILGDSSTELSKLKGKFDYIYIDGDHTYEGVVKDLEAAHKKLAKAGKLVCDDYGNPCGVKQAVDEFCEKYGYNKDIMEGNPNGAVILTRN